ncbi:MAG: hypothetical protein KDA45_01320, partial [Planctomycetales bacterium]|nr:hypothetical protein [Planctomycetales bacterium]
MKRTSTRLAAIGGIVVLGAFAIALAQHDARKREREQPPLKPIASQPATPIPVEDTDGGWGSQRSSPTKLVVRGNNDPLANDLQANKRSIDDLQRGEPRSAELPRGGNFALPDTAADNPLRAAGGSDAGERSQVIPASGGVPVEAPGGGSSGGRRPAWLGGTGASAGAGQEPELPKLPSFPMNTVGKPDSPTGAVPGTVVGSGANPLPSLASPMPAPPTTLSSNVGDMSDTQRGALPATEMSPLQSLPGTPFAGGSAIPSGGSPLPTAAAFPTDSPAAYSPPNMPTAPVGALPPSSSSQARLEYVPEDGSRGEARLPHNGAPASGGLPPNSAAERS